MTDHQPGPLPGSYWVRPGRLMAGPHPGARHEDDARARVQAMLGAGVTTFVDLTERRGAYAYAAIAHQEAPHVQGDLVQYRQHPIPDMTVPTPATMRAILDTIDDALAAGEVVYVHCMAGLGRTGTVIGCWLVRHGLSGNDALDEIVRLRGGQTDSPETAQQIAMVRHWREGDENA